MISSSIDSGNRAALRRRAAVIAMSLAVIGMTLHLAAPPAPGRQVDLLEAYRLAEKRDPQLAAARNQREAQLEQVPRARALLLPQVSASASASRIWEDTERDAPPPENRALPFGSVEGTSSYNSANMGIDVRQMLFRQQAFVALRQARIVEDQATARFELARQALTLQVADAYFGVAKEEDAVRTFEAELRAVEEELEHAERRYELGVGGVIEVNDARARHAATRANLLRSRNQLRLARETLSRRLGEPVTQVVRLRDDFTPELPRPKDPETWVRAAEKENFEVHIATYSLNVAKAGVDLARTERYPQLDLVVSFRREYQGENPLARGSRVETDQASVGIELSFPLYTGGDISASVRQRIAERKAGSNQLLDARRQAALSAETAFIAIESSVEQTAALLAALEAVQLAEASTRRGIDLGQRTMLDLLNVQRERFQVERNLAEARYQYLLAYLQLHAAAGKTLDRAIMSVNTLLCPAALEPTARKPSG